MKKPEEYTPSELATLATIVGVIVASKLNVNGQNVVGNFIEAAGQTILLIAAQAQNIQSQQEAQNGDNGSNSSKINNSDLQKQINELKEYIKKIEDNMNS